MRIFKRLLLFLAVNLLIACAMNFVLTDPSIVRIYLEDIEQNDYDTLIIGTSHGETGFDPFLMSEGLDAKVFNASRRLMPVPDLYYLLKTANAGGSLKTVYYELDPTYWNAVMQIKTHDDTCMLRHASIPDRIEYAAKYLMGENYNYTLFPYNFDMKTLKKAPGIVRSKVLLSDLPPDERIRGIYSFLNISKNFDYIGRGFRAGREKDPLADETFEPLFFAPENIAPEYHDAFSDMVRYCREEAIRLVCVVSALPEKRLVEENYPAAHEYFRRLCDENGVKFFDMNALRPGLLPRTPEDYTDLDGHMMGELARRQTQLLIELEKARDREAFFVNDLSAALTTL